MRFSHELVDAIKDRTDIVDLINTYVPLKRAGSVFNGLCPFHSEKTPSFTVFPDTQSFFCFGCEAGGDVFTFIMRTENLDYPGAVEFLAKRAGVELPAEDAAYEKRGLSRKRVFEMNLIAARYFRACLFDPEIGADAMKYLTEKRGLSVPFIRHFGIGYAPNSFSALTPILQEKGYTVAEMKEAFLCGVSQFGRSYDYFRDRVMFPVIDNTGNVIAFSGRDVGGESKAKYLNTSDTPAFQKRKNLFALNFAKNHCAEQMILCEGNMDAVSLHAAGFENAVASLGTALTDEQARIIAKYTKQVIIAYDADEAGQRAANRAMGIFAKVGVEVRILQMQGAKDPDEFLQKFGAARFAEILKRTRTGFEFKFQNVLAKHDITRPEEKIKAADELCAIIARVYSTAEREVYLHAVAERLELSQASLQKDVERMIARNVKEYRKKESHQAQVAAGSVRDMINPEAAAHVQAAAAEGAIIGLLLLYGEHRKAVQTGQIALTSADFVTEFHRRAFEKIMELEASDGGFSFALLGESFNPDEMGRLARLEQERHALSENGTSVLRSAVDMLTERKERDAAKSASPLEGISRILDQKRKQINKP